MPAPMPPPCLSIRIPTRERLPSIPPFGISTYSHRRPSSSTTTTTTRNTKTHRQAPPYVPPQIPSTSPSPSPSPSEKSFSNTDVEEDETSIHSVERIATASISLVQPPSLIRMPSQLSQLSNKSSLDLPKTIVEPPTPTPSDPSIHPIILPRPSSSLSNTLREEPHSPTGTFISVASTDSTLFRAPSRVAILSHAPHGQGKGMGQGMGKAFHRPVSSLSSSMSVLSHYRGGETREGKHEKNESQSSTSFSSTASVVGSHSHATVPSVSHTHSQLKRLEMCPWESSSKELSLPLYHSSKEKETETETAEWKKLLLVLLLILLVALVVADLVVLNVVLFSRGYGDD